jgi:hypothetical protein
MINLDGKYDNSRRVYCLYSYVINSKKNPLFP